MFIHIAKDFMKKLDDVDARLPVSLDREEIQTLGLKLRFYFNEVRHYRALLTDIHNRIIQIQDKYGFKPDERAVPASQEDPPAVKSEYQETVRLLTDWLVKLQRQGLPPRQVLSRVNEFIDQVSRPQVDVNIPGEMPEYPITALDPNLEDATGFADQSAIRNPQSEEVAGAAGEANAKTPAASPLEYTEFAETVAPAALEPCSGDKDEPIHNPQSAIPDPAAPEPAEAAQVQAAEADIEPAALLEYTKFAEPAAPVTPEPGPADQSAIPVPEPPIDELLHQWSLQYSGEHELPLILFQKMNETFGARRAEVMVWLDDFILAGNKNPAGKNGILLFMAGCFANELGRQGLAINLIEQSIAAGAAFALSYLILARCYQAKKITEKALINYKFASNIDTALPEARLGVAACLLAMNQPEPCLEALDVEMFEEEDHKVEAAILKAQALEKSGRMAEAVALLTETAACSISKQAASCRFLLGTFQEKGRDILKAIDFYENALAADPDHLTARYNLGRLYFQHQAIPLARKHLFYLIKNHPDTTWADKAREMLQHHLT